jgi:hypothetical protein
MQIRILYPYYAVLVILGPLFWYWLRHTPRRLSPLRRRLLMGVRLLVLALIIAGLVRFSLTQVSQQVNVVFLLDLSHSIAAATRQQALDFIRAVSQHKPLHDGVGVVVFGADALVEQGVSRQLTLSDVTSQIEGTATNIARAIQVGIASFPSEGVRRLVLLSDGNENVGAAAEAALIARSLGVQVFALPLGRPAHESEVQVDKLLVPAQVKGGTPYRVEAVVSSTSETPASLVLFREGALVDRLKVTLRPGKNRYPFLQSASAEGVQLYQLVVNSLQDTIPDNNRWQAFTEVVGRPKLLLVYDPPERSTALVEALRAHGLKPRYAGLSRYPNGKDTIWTVTLVSCTLLLRLCLAST